MTLAQIKVLGANIIRAIDGKDRKRLVSDVADIVSALALLDKRRPPALPAPKSFSADELTTIRKCVGIECRYLSEEPVPHVAPSTGSVVEHLEARVVARARKEFDIFVEFVGLDEKLQPMVQAPMHRRWTQLRSAHKRLVMKCHNSAGKTTQNIIFFALHELGINPNLRIAILCNTSARAMDWLRAISDLILHNENVRKVFPQLVPHPGGPWSATQITVARTATLKEPSIGAYGATKASGILGTRVDLLLADDLVDKENSDTLAGIEDLITWWRSTAETRLAGEERVVYCGTPWRPGDLLDVLSKNELYKVVTFPILDPATGRSTWPSVWPEWRIEQRRKALQELEFARCMLCLARADSISAFKEAQIKRAVELGADYPAVLALEDVPGGLPEGAAIYTGVDLATGSKKKRRDDSALATILVEKDGRHTLLHLEAGRWTPDVLRQKIDEQSKRWSPKVIAVESNGTQALFVAELKRAGLPVTEFITSAANKFDAAQGIEGQTILFQNELYVIPQHVAESPAGRALVHGWLFYDRNSHTPDLVMAAWIAFNIARADKRATRTVPTVTCRIVGGDERTTTRTFVDSAARDRFYEEQRQRGRSFHERITSVIDVSDEEIADAHAARRDRLGRRVA